MALYQLVYRFQDLETDNKLASMPIWLADTGALADYLALAQALSLKIDAVTDSLIVEQSLVIPLALSGSLKGTQNAGALNERGGLITFGTNGPHKDSIRVPAFNRTIMPGTTIDLADTNVAAFITQLQTTVNGLTPKTRNNFSYTDELTGKRSFRRK